MVDVLDNRGSAATQRGDPDTLLRRAATRGSISEARRLLREGADPDLPDRHGWTSMHWAATDSKHSNGSRLQTTTTSEKEQETKRWSASFDTHRDHSSLNAASSASPVSASVDALNGLEVKYNQ